MWTYQQTTGELVNASGEVIATGYSGRGRGKNNPVIQAVVNVGPIPRGTYTIQPPQDTASHGPYVLWLEPDPSNIMDGRSGFGIHGDSKARPGDASNGCIVLSHSTRAAIWASGDRTLAVTA